MRQLIEKVCSDFNWSRCHYCKEGAVWMLTLGGLFFRMKCMNCRRHTSLFVMSSEAMSAWSEK